MEETSDCFFTNSFSTFPGDGKVDIDFTSGFSTLPGEVGEADIDFTSGFSTFPGEVDSEATGPEVAPGADGGIEVAAGTDAGGEVDAGADMATGFDVALGASLDSCVGGAALVPVWVFEMGLEDVDEAEVEKEEVVKEEVVEEEVVVVVEEAGLDVGSEGEEVIDCDSTVSWCVGSSSGAKRKTWWPLEGNEGSDPSSKTL